MDRTIYALLVAIDRYPPPTTPLYGCVNDLSAMRTFLEWRVGAGRLETEVLTDDQATREAFLRRFRVHLGRARAGDTALFYFAGHGSQETLPLEYFHQEPDALAETLVLYDSRQSGRWDLADKELRLLIAEVAAGGAHVIVILDCCHSGTATREGAERWTPPRQSPRPAATYWFYDQAKLPAGLNPAGDWSILPLGRHVALSACRDCETAKELTIDGERRGLFSYTLVSTLTRLGTEVSYRELHKQVQILVKNRKPSQTPQAEGDLDVRIFDGALPPRPKAFHLRWAEDPGGWRLDAGAVHGLRAGSELAVFAVDAPDLQDLAARLATARLIRVEAAESVATLDRPLPPDSCAFPAVFLSFPIEPLAVALAGDSASRKPLTGAISASPYLRLADHADAADVVARAEAAGWVLCRAATAEELPAPLAGNDLGEVVRALEHIARWQSIYTLDNPGSSLDQEVSMELYEWIERPTSPGFGARKNPLPNTGEIVLPYRCDGGEPRPGRFTVHLHNQGARPIFFALLALDESFAVKRVSEAWGCLAPGHEFRIREGDGIPASVPDRFYRQGVTERRDLLLLLLSEVEADFSLLEQGCLGLPCVPREKAQARGGGSLLGTLMRRLGWREVDDEEPLVAHRWGVKRQVIVARRTG